MGFFRSEYRDVPDLFGKGGSAAARKLSPDQAKEAAKKKRATKSKGGRTLSAKEQKDLIKKAKAAEKDMKRKR